MFLTSIWIFHQHTVAETVYLSLLLVLCFFYRYFDDIDDEMDPEIEEAYEKFCLESEHGRKQWEVTHKY